MHLDRIRFGELLQKASTGSAAPNEVQKVLRGVLLSTPALSGSADDHLIRSVAERIDTVTSDPARLRSLAHDLGLLLMRSSSAEVAELLLEVVAERRRVLQVLERHSDGVVTRTGFLSFVSAQNWPKLVRTQVGALSDPGLEGFRAALNHLSVEQLEEVLGLKRS
jgi:hypothetical protein